MKVKLDFVTNSSSSSYIIASSLDQVGDLKEFINELNKNHHESGGVRIYNTFNTIEELKEYTNDGPYDWASKPMGLQFINYEKEIYYQIKEIIDKGCVAIECGMDHNIRSKFNTSMYSDMIVIDME